MTVSNVSILEKRIQEARNAVTADTNDNPANELRNDFFERRLFSRAADLTSANRRLNEAAAEVAQIGARLTEQMVDPQLVVKAANEFSDAAAEVTRCAKSAREEIEVVMNIIGD